MFQSFMSVSSSPPRCTSLCPLTSLRPSLANVVCHARWQTEQGQCEWSTPPKGCSLVQKAIVASSGKTPEKPGRLLQCECVSK